MVLRQRPETGVGREEWGLAMIDPIVAVSAVLAFAMMVTAILLGRRASERARHDLVIPRSEQSETHSRYVNGGWH
jgi:hypothetical protein